MSRVQKVVATALAVFVAGLAVENAVSMACPMEKSERCACCDDNTARISDDANECCSVLTVARRAIVPAELSPVPTGAAASLSISSGDSAPFFVSFATTLHLVARALAPPGIPAFLANLSIRC